MPTYDYYCTHNGRTVEVFHGISTRLTCWGELVSQGATEADGTPDDAPIERQIGGGTILTRTASPQQQPGGC